MTDHLDLLDYRRRVFAMYDALRRDTRAEALRLVTFRTRKDRLFAEHPQSPIPPEERRAFRGLAYWRHDPELRISARLEPDPAAPSLDLPRSAEGVALAFARIGWVSFATGGTDCRLAVYWLNDYAGGIFIPFLDASSGDTTYGGGRYLWDSAKGADLGSDGTHLTLDFNYAYHPSCTYDPRWSCPLAPPENRLSVAIEAGERLEGVTE
jgi:uncharacterized protein (DUF1684 family)